MGLGGFCRRPFAGLGFSGKAPNILAANKRGLYGRNLAVNAEIKPREKAY